MKPYKLDVINCDFKNSVYPMDKTESSLVIPIERIEQCIYIIRGQKVMLDQDLAILYRVTTGRLNEQVNRNIDRFPVDFAFRLNMKEWESLMSQIAISNELVDFNGKIIKKRQGRGGRRKLPIAFTEQGVAMLSGVLHSPQAVAMNIEIMRAFVRMRHVLASQQQLTKELADIKSFLLKHTNSSDREFRRIWRAIENLSEPPAPAGRPIGFDLN